jgi:hypothetical protein
MKKLFYLLMLLLVLFVVSSVFKGGEYIRLISAKTGVNLGVAESIADSLSLGDFMREHSGQTQQAQKKRAGG